MIDPVWPKVSVFIATSLDGFISRKDGSIDWLMKFNETVPQGEDCGYKTFIDTIDTIIMGRNTFEQILTFDDWPYKNKQLVVLSKKYVNIPDKLKEIVTSSSDLPKKIILNLGQKNCRGVYIDGGLTIQSFLLENLVDELIITTIPILIGEGKPLFGNLNHDINLKLVYSKSYPFGVVQSKYKIQNSN